MIVSCRVCGFECETEALSEKMTARGWAGQSVRVEHYFTGYIAQDGHESRTVYHRLRWNQAGSRGRKTGSICVGS